MTTKGTPKTLIEAIENGFEDFDHSLEDWEFCKKYISMHVRDYIINKLAHLMFSGTDSEIKAVKKIMRLIDNE